MILIRDLLIMLVLMLIYKINWLLYVTFFWFVFCIIFIFVHIFYQEESIMVNKQGLWFLTLFSLILVLSIYYITMPNEIFKSEEVVANDNNTKDDKDTSEVNSQNTSYIETLKVELDSERAEILNTLEEILNDNSKSSSEKNKAYEQMKEINNLKASEEQIVKTINEEYKLDAYVKQEDSKIEVVIDSKEHDVKLANKIMRTIQSDFNEPMSISVKFS